VGSVPSARPVPYNAHRSRPLPAIPSLVMSQRFFIQTPITTPTVKLEGPEAHHLIHVMRAQIGEHLVLFDGTGAEFVGQIERIGRKQVSLQVESRDEVDRELRVPLVLAVALPRGDRQEWLVEKAVELGVSRLVPWQTERSVARVTEKSIERLRRTVIEASKQCGRNRLMEVESPWNFNAYVECVAEGPSLLAHPYFEDDVSPQPTWTTLERKSLGEGVRMGIGPEGGFSDVEVQQALKAGWWPIRLGPRILRTETAALALAAHVALILADERGTHRAPSPRWSQ
jgi:16S rRNA (uracil1498-N3)-methyltransferase